MEYQSIIDNTKLSYGKRYRMLVEKWCSIKTDNPMQSAKEAARFDSARSSLECQVLTEKQ